LGWGGITRRSIDNVHLSASTNLSYRINETAKEYYWKIHYLLYALALQKSVYIKKVCLYLLKLFWYQSLLSKIRCRQIDFENTIKSYFFVEKYKAFYGIFWIKSLRSFMINNALFENHLPCFYSNLVKLYLKAWQNQCLTKTIKIFIS